MRLLILAFLSLAFAGCTSMEERQAHVQGQIEIVRSQSDAKTDQKAAEALAKAELYKALAEVAKANPEQASAVTVALAVQGLGEAGESGNTPIVPLQPLRNEGLEFAKVFAAPLANVTTAVATAYINADVAKTQSDNAAAVQINDALQDSRIVEAVANVGMAAAETSGLFVSGDNYTVTDEGYISQDSFSSVETTTTTTTTNTETNSETNTSNSVADSYNTQNETINDTTTMAVSLNTTLNYEGANMTLAELIAQLNAAGATYSIDVNGDGTPDVTGDGEGDEVKINCGATFGPLPPECLGG